jgi:hypothetical protein
VEICKNGVIDCDRIRVGMEIGDGGVAAPPPIVERSTATNCLREAY